MSKEIWRDIAVRLMLTSSIVNSAVLSLVLEKEWFLWLLVLFGADVECTYWVHFFPFGPNSRHHIQWRRRRRVK